MTSGEAVVVSGLGVVSCQGCTLDDQRRGLAAGRAVLTEVDREAGYHRARGAREAALVDPTCFRSILPPLKARRMSPPSRFAMVAARQALDDAGIGDAWSELPEAISTAVVVGTSYGPSSYTERILRQVLLENPEAASPMLFTESVANAPAAQIALALDCRGPNVTVTQREASVLLAIAQGADLVRSGVVRRALVGGVEEVNPLLHAILDRFGALAGSRRPRRPGESEQARPLDQRRDGANLAEGAAVLLLERRQDVERRGGSARAAVGSALRAFDPVAPATGWSEAGGPLADRVVDWWRGVAPERQAAEELFVSSASGRPDQDRCEAALVRAVAGDGARVTTPRTVFGDAPWTGPVGALLALESGALGAVDGFRVDPVLRLEPAAGGERPAACTLTATAAGGSCCWLRLESVDAP